MVDQKRKYHWLRPGVFDTRDSIWWWKSVQGGAKFQILPRQPCPGEAKFWFLSRHGGEFGYFGMFWRGICAFWQGICAFWQRIVPFGEARWAQARKNYDFCLTGVSRWGVNHNYSSPGYCRTPNFASPTTLSPNSGLLRMCHTIDLSQRGLLDVQLRAKT